MKKLLLLVLSFLTLAGGFWWVNAELNPFEAKQTFLDLKEAERKWGAQPFSEGAFRKGSVNERAKMSVDIIKRKRFLGLSMSEVKSRLGENTGYFWNDQIPAYLIEEGWQTGSDTWQIVFLPGIGGKIKDVRIHKNCCS